MFAILLLLIAFRPFISSPAFPYLDFAYSYIFILCVIIFILRNKGSFLPRPIIKSALIYIFLACLTLASLNHSNSIIQLYKFFYLLSVYLLFANLNLNLRKSAIRIIIVCSSLLSLYALHYLVFGSKHLTEVLAINNIDYPFAFEFLGRERASAPFVLPSMLSCYLVMSLALTFGYLLPSKLSPRAKFLLISALISPIISGIILTKSIGGILSLLSAVLIASFAYGAPNPGDILSRPCRATSRLRNAKKRSSTDKTVVFRRRDKTWAGKRLRFIPLLLILALALAYSLRKMNSAEWTTVEFSFARRFAYWQEALYYIGRHPFGSIGLGNYRGLYSLFAHNSYLQVWIEGGLAAIIALLALIYISTRATLIKQGIFHKAMFIMSLAFLVNNIFDFSFYLPEVSFLWWMYLGINE